MGLEEETLAQVWGTGDVGIGMGLSGKKQSNRKEEKREEG